MDSPHPPAELFAYLADPRNRAEWQSSLRSVSMIDEGVPRVGMRWRETTVVGIHPHVQITELVPYRTWAEVGVWRGVEGRLTLRFKAIAGGCRLTAQGRVSGSGVWAVAAQAAGRLAPHAVRHDLAAAAGVLTRRGSLGWPHHPM